ncbi:PKD domain-containing protein [Porifericola rhodea]|uniref:PKD domain-containing protein n=1 Tax=Porifericola rhodea TaxID=930972 RepID=UPI002665C1A6|nr:PKD domain-containing protein [Porifericola rhodea]WKN29792.1 PKD domain-containing protein [Porifericola rhodea]
MFPNTVYAQCLDLEISMSSETVCIGEPFDVGVSQANLEYSWDFCPGDILMEPANTFQVATLPQSQRSLGLAIAKGKEGWYGLATSRDNNSVIRFYFGDGLQSPPTAIENLGNVNTLLDQPASIQLFYRNSAWYALVHNWGSNNLVLLNFGESLSGEPSSEEWVDNIGGGNSFLEVVNTPDSVIAIVTNTNAKLSVVHIPEDLTTKPGTGDRFETSTLSGFSTLMDLEIVNVCGEWYGFAASLNNRKLFRVHFGNSPYSEPALVQEIGSSLFGSDKPAGLQLIQENGEYIALVNTTSGQLYRAVLGSSISNQVTSENIDQVGSGFGVGYDLAFGKSEGSWFGYVINDKNGSLFQVDFPQSCDASLAYSKLQQPEGIYYTNAGKQYVNIETINGNGVVSSTTDSLQVLETVAPEIDIVLDKQCIGGPIQLIGQAGEAMIVSYNWSIDGDVETGDTVNYNFPAAGTYEVTLEVETPDGCGNRLTKEVTIYEPPAPKFTVDQSVVCTNGAVQFTNLSDIKGASDVITYEWSFNGEGSSTDANPVFTFTTGGTKTVSLTTTIPGCSNTYDTTFTVVQGPVVDFSTSPQICQGEEVTFENLTSGDNITAYQWSFGDGGSFSSITKDNPVYTYDSAGTYLAVLEVSNASACETSLTKTLTVYSRPAADFSADIACAGAPTQFVDESTTGINSNIVAWDWIFGDGEGSSKARNPQYTYDVPGLYEATLVVLTSAGCQDTIKKEIVVEPAVQASFTNQQLCPSETEPFTIQFADASTSTNGEKVTEWLWTINGENFVIANPSYTFDEPGTYQVSLTVFSNSACNASVTQNITVKEVPEADFAFEPKCAGSEVIFTNLSQHEGVEVTSYQWNFGGEGASFEENPAFIFDEEGTYKVSLTLETAEACSYTVEKEVVIAAQPNADFSTDVTYGGAPLTVNFVSNTSEASSDSYRWQFGDLASAQQKDTTFTFTQPGTYTVSLEVSNTLGCSDISTQTINVVEPVSDLQLERVSVLSEEGDPGIIMLLTIRNNGTLKAGQFSIDISLDQVLNISKIFDRELGPGEVVNFPLDFSVSTQQSRNIDLKYVCATLENHPEEENLANNRYCTSLENNFTVISPYPNPSKDKIQVDLVLPQQENVDIKLMTIQGETLQNLTFSNTKTGLNTFTLDVSTMVSGYYLLQVDYLTYSKVHRLVVNP